MSAPVDLVCLMGPTASGKTDLAIELAGRLDCELISVDSALVYRGLDIGSAKPDYPHHLVDIRDPAESWSVADFCAEAVQLVEDIRGRGRLPLLVGGTMLYFKALLQGLAEMPPSDPALRAQIEAEAARDGWPGIHERLSEVDPESAARIHPNHSQRLARALEVWLASGVTLSEWHRRAGDSPGPLSHLRTVQMAICPADRACLHERLAQRTRQMIAAGLEEEVRALHARADLHVDLPAIRAVGYRQMWGYLEGEYDLARAVELIVIATRQLAKRQLTWLRGWPNLCWIYTDSEGRATPDRSIPAENPQSPLDLALKYLESGSI